VFENVIEAMVDAVLVVDVEGAVTLTNTAAARLTGYSVNELRGMPIAQLLSDERSGLRTVVRRRIEDGAVLRREESWLIPKGGSPIPVSVTGSPVMSDSGLQGIVLVARDVREIRELLAPKESGDRAPQGRGTICAPPRRRSRSSSTRPARRCCCTPSAAPRRHAAGRRRARAAQHRADQVAAVDELLGALSANEDVTALTARCCRSRARRRAHHRARQAPDAARAARADHVGPIDLNAVVRDVIAMLRGAAAAPARGGHRVGPSR
jgi:PAS domain S-box-containing protein